MKAAAIWTLVFLGAVALLAWTTSKAMAPGRKHRALCYAMVCEARAGGRYCLASPFYCDVDLHQRASMFDQDIPLEWVEP